MQECNETLARDGEAALDVLQAAGGAASVRAMMEIRMEVKEYYVDYDHSHLEESKTMLLAAQSMFPPDAAQYVEAYREGLATMMALSEEYARGNEVFEAGIHEVLKICQTKRAKLMDQTARAIIVARTALGIGEFLLAAFSIFIAYGSSGQIKRSLSQCLEALLQMARGDLSFTLAAEQLEAKDEFGQLMRGMSEHQEKLRTVVNDVQSSASQIANASEQLSRLATGVSEATGRQAANAEEVSGSMEEMAASIEMNSDKARETDQLAAKMHDQIARVATNAGSASEKVSAIASHIGVIRDIVYQTNILALNAAVEAARGRTWAWV